MPSDETQRPLQISGQNQAAELPIAPKRVSQRQTQLTSFAQRPLNKRQKEEADKYLIEMFTRSFHAFSLLDEEPFKNLLHSLSPTYEIPSRAWVSRTALPMAYEQCKARVTEMVKEAKAVCITTDCWTSRNINSYCAVTAHFIDDSYRLVSVLLDCSNMDISHTANNLATELHTIVTSFQLNQKVALAVSDNAANIKKAIELLRWKHFGCMAHTINLIVQDGLKSNTAVKEVLQKVKQIVTFFRKSPTNHKIVLNYQASQGVQTPLKLINECPTRWNSTLYMVERFVQLENAVKTSMALINSQLPNLSAIEWQILKDLSKILKPWENATTALSGEVYQTASIVISLVDGLNSVNNKIKSMDLQPDVTSVANNFSCGIQKRLSGLKSSRTLCLSTFCDPRFKNITFADNQVKQWVIEEVAQEISADTSTSEEASTEPSSTTEVADEFSLWDAFDKIAAEYAPIGTPTSRAIVEVQRYLESGVISRHDCPLKWWMNNKYKYPHLGRVAQRKLGVLATSVPCERLFSKAGEVLTERRSSLKPKHLNMILFLNSNSKYLEH